MENLPSVHALLKPRLHSTGRHAASAVAESDGFTNLLFSKDCRCVLFHFFLFGASCGLGRGAETAVTDAQLLNALVSLFPPS